ncbi:MAG: HPF/RaiA family ribosome-associated protein, partial [Saprospiraceae bacterium]
MNTTIHNTQDTKEGTRRFIIEKLEKLETFSDRIERCDVYIKTDDGNINTDGYTVQARLAIPGNDLFAEFTDESIEKAATEVTDKLRRQLI